MSTTKINCNFPNCTESFETREDLRKHVDEAKHQETIHVIVRNLAYAFSLEDLKAEFSAFNPREVRISTNKDGRSKGFALAFFDKEEDRTAAIEALNDKELGGRKIKVSKPHPRPRVNAVNTVYIGKFKETPTEEAIRAAFEGIAISEVQIMKVAAEKDYAYVTFATEDDYKKALEISTVLDANVEPKRSPAPRRRRAPRKPAAAAATTPAAAAPKGEETEKPKADKTEKPRRPRRQRRAAAAAAPAAAAGEAEEVPKSAFVKNTVHVGKLPIDVDRKELVEKLKELFASLNPTSVKVSIRKSHGRFRAIAYGVVAFATEEEYAKALEIKKLGESDIVVDPKRAVSRQRRAAAPAATTTPAPRKVLKDTLFVGRLPNIITDEGLHEIFDGCAFKEAKIHEGKNSKYGVVVFANEEDAQKALETVKGTSVEGKEIIVEFKRDIAEKKN